MKKIIKNCYQCGYHIGYYMDGYYCDHPKKIFNQKKPFNECSEEKKEKSKYFPKWCPLKNAL